MNLNVTNQQSEQYQDPHEMMFNEHGSSKSLAKVMKQSTILQLS